MPSWAPEAVARWLATIEMTQYAANFLENDIDGGALLTLTATELKDDLEVAKLGHRKRILNNIEELRFSESAAVLAPQHPPAVSNPPWHSGDSLSSNISGHTVQSPRLGPPSPEESPETLRELNQHLELAQSSLYAGVAPSTFGAAETPAEVAEISPEAYANPIIEDRLHSLQGELSKATKGEATPRATPIESMEVVDEEMGSPSLDDHAERMRPSLPQPQWH